MAELVGDGTRVPIDDGADVDVFPGMPWPSAYRGSRYSVKHASGGDREFVLVWQYDDLGVQLDPPEGLVEMLRDVGKSNGAGTGSIRITAGREVLTKVHTDNYRGEEDTPVSDGWAPVYLGRLYGELPFAGIDIDPDPGEVDSVQVWDGLPFNHGERWALGYNGKLVWKWRDYRFQSAFDHSELAAAYQRFRPGGGRLYINENGHVFGNVPQHELSGALEQEVAEAFAAWNERTRAAGDAAARRLVTRRLERTGDGNPAEGHLPVHLGHLDQFDDGYLPQPVVTDPAYYKHVGEGEQLYG
jgi:hypothetical protein